jgi:hypothetical protein
MEQDLNDQPVIPSELRNPSNVQTAPLSRGRRDILNMAPPPRPRPVPTVYEPRFLELFRDLRLSTPPGSPLRFGHILAPSAAPPALLEADGGAVSGMPAIGVCATVRSQSLDSQGHLLVEYEGMRRFRLLGLDDVSKPYMIGMACWLDDEPPQNAGAASAPAAVGPGAGVDTAGLEWRPEEWQARVDALEAEVLGTLREVARWVGAPRCEGTGVGRAPREARGQGGGVWHG